MGPDPTMKSTSFFTLKRVLACLGIVAVTTLAILEVLRGQERKQWNLDRAGCLESMGRMHKALTLYRADFDDFSPAFVDKGRAAIMERLKKYAADKAVSCVKDPDSGRPELRVVEKSETSDVMFPYGIEDNSLELEPCYEHMRYHTVAKLDGLFPTTRYEPELPTGGVLNVLLRSGTAKPIPGTIEDVFWIFESGVFKPEGNLKRPVYARSIRMMPFEPKPPKFEY